MKERACIAGIYDFSPQPPFNSSDRVELYRSVLRGEFKVPYFILPRAQSLLFRVSVRLLTHCLILFSSVDTKRS